MTSEARASIDEARGELGEIKSKAHEDIQAVVELGQPCKEEPTPPADEDPEITLVSLTDQEEEDDTVTLTFVVQFSEPVTCDGECKDLFTYKANEDVTTTAQASDFDLAEDGESAEVSFELDATVEIDGANDEVIFTADTASLKDEDDNPVATQTENPVEVDVDTSDLVAKYREIVDLAILDMQVVMDDVMAIFDEMAVAAETVELADDESVKEDRGKAKTERAEERAKDKSERAKNTDNRGKGKPEGAGSKGKGKGRG
jgi:hypothetical protein